MKRVLKFLFLFVFIISACVPINAPGSNTEYTLGHALKSTVSVQLRNPGSTNWITVGSGTVVRQENALYFGSRPKYAVLTAEHVMNAIGSQSARACSDILVKACVPFLSGYRGGGTSASSFEGDWALVPFYSIPDGMQPIRVRKESIRVGEPLYFIGYPWGDFLISNGIGSGYRMDGITRIDKAYGYVAPGSSGGAVLDKRGRLVGIVVGIPIKRGPNNFPTYQHDIVLIVSVDSVVWKLPKKDIKG